MEKYHEDMECVDPGITRQAKEFGALCRYYL